MRSIADYISERLAILVAALILPLLAGCVDDGLDAGFAGEYPEGETMVRFSLDFQPFGAGGAAGTRSVGGKTMDRLDDLCLLAYDLDGNLMEGFPIEITAADHNLKVTEQGRTDADASGGITAESSTRHATFDVTVPFGNYYLYGVSNLGSRDKEGNILQSTFQALSDPYGELHQASLRRDDMLAYQAAWDEDNCLNNFEMLGNFTNADHKTPPSTGDDMNNVKVSVARPGITIHGWLRRCASKVTIDFDGSGLRENIKVYIKRATIHDIVRSCALGRPNAAADKKDIISYKNSDYRPDAAGKGDCIIYGTGDDHTAWPYVSKGHPDMIIGQDTPDFKQSETSPRFHDEAAPSMFMYENMQGESLDDKTNKEQHPTSGGLVVGADDMKDNMELGTYVEVEGWYEQNSNGAVSSGKIIYRFMLGKDTRKNFDVERNHHMKLTLKLRGNGNDVDWHIEYNRSSRFEYKDPYYVSYLYNHDSTLHFRYTPEKGRKVVKLKVQIVGNNWWPEDLPEDNYYSSQAEEQSPFSPEERTLNDLRKASFEHNNYPEEDKVFGKNMFGKPRTRYLGNGFLSLRATSQNVLTFDDMTGAPGNDTDAKMTRTTWTEDDAHRSINDLYFYGLSTGSGGIDRSVREFDIANPDADPANDGREAYSVEPYPDDAIRINIPVFTRAKNLIKESGYSGQNPYNRSRRVAYLRVTAVLDDGSEDPEIMRVVQVPRVENPKGVYRSPGNNEPFAVTLYERKGNVEEYTAVESDGPWMAEVLSNDANFITLNGRSTITGSTGSNVNFRIFFNRAHTGTKVRSAVVRVRYNNYSCVHLIFVRQGYAPQKLYANGPKWETRNFITKSVIADDPRDEGSMFKYGCIDSPIDAINNEPEWQYHMLPTEKQFKPAGGLHLAKDDKSYDKSTVTWSSIKGDMGTGFPGMSIPTVVDYRELICSKKDFDTHTAREFVSHAFGVLYADGATSTKQKVSEAYGYSRYGDQSYGMRGVFVYYYKSNDLSNQYNFRSIFFPIGRSGHGHRRANDTSTGGKDNSNDGTLRYAAGRNADMPSPAVWFQPLFFDLWRRPGAIYWASGKGFTSSVTDEWRDDYMAFDLNYHTLDVNFLYQSNLQKHSQWSGCTDPECIDACFLRGVVKD